MKLSKIPFMTGLILVTMLAACSGEPEAEPPALLPAPVGGNPTLAQYPTGYEAFTFATTVDKASNNQVRDIYANDVALNSAASGTLDRGSVVVMEIFGAQLDASEQPVLDTDGRYIRGDLNIIAVMEKQEGFGQYTEETKNGEWEYAFYTPDGQALANEADCYGCHKENAGESKDFVFTLDQLKAPAALPMAPIGGAADLVTFPANYQSFAYATTVDKSSNNQVRDIYANDIAMNSAASGTLDRGSVVVMEIFGAQLESDAPKTDESGRYIRDTLNIVAVMEKKEGNGQYNPMSRNGEWEYAFFTTDGAPIETEADCFGCHKDNAGAGKDFIFTLDSLRAPQMLPDAPLGGNHDLVSYPEAYPNNFRMYTSVDKASNNQVRDMFANDIAIQSAASGSLAQGSVLVMEIYGAQLDMNGDPVTGPDTRYIRDTLNIVAVMEKKQGFGKYSDDTRNDEWEYAFFMPNGAPLESEADCYGCHKENAGASLDFVFTLQQLSELR